LPISLAVVIGNLIRSILVVGAYGVRTVKTSGKDAVQQSNAVAELRADLAQRIAQFMGSAENLFTGIPGLALHRRTAPTVPLSVTYEPCVAVVVQGRKRVELGPTTFIYDASRFLLTWVDLPVVSQVIEATKHRSIRATHFLATTWTDQGLRMRRCHQVQTCVTDQASISITSPASSECGPRDVAENPPAPQSWPVTTRGWLHCWICGRPGRFIDPFPRIPRRR
jgi:hypothetical protein